MLGPLCDQTVNLKTNVSWNYNIVLLVYSTTKARRNTHRWTTAIMTATEITRTGYFYKTTLIDRSLRPTGRMPWTVLRLWGFLCVRDAGRRGNKITATYLSSGRGTETLSFQKIKAYALILTRQQFWKKSHLSWANKHAWVALMSEGRQGNNVQLILQHC